MRYITSIERIGIQKGLQQGLQQGLRQGQVRKVRQNITTVIKERFGDVPANVTQAINSIEQEPTLDQLFHYALMAEALPNFQQKLVEIVAH